MPRAAAKPAEKQEKKSPTIFREIHVYVPSSKDPETGEDVSESLEVHEEMTPELDRALAVNPKANHFCCEYTLDNRGRRQVICGVQLPYELSKKWFELGMDVVDVSGVVKTLLSKQREEERQDDILQALLDTQKQNSALLEALVTRLEQVEGK